MGAVIQRLKECIPPKTRGRLKHKYLCKWYGTEWSYGRRWARFQTVLEKPVIHVVFQVENLGKWKCQSVLDEMMRHPRFRPSVWFVADFEATPEMVGKNRSMVNAFFERQGVKVLQYPNLQSFPEQEKPDLVFVCEPYFHVMKMPHNEGLFDYLICYVSYGIRNMLKPDSFSTIITHAALFNFYENAYIASLGAQFMESGMRNIKVTGHPGGDALLFPSGGQASVWHTRTPGMKKVIWAPHWTINKDCFFGASTFLEHAAEMQALANEYEGRIQFAFKPHPTLRHVLYAHPEWGREKTDAYYQWWQERPNTQLELGEYANLFMQSDAMVHDCGSFMVEYQYADKPCMFLQTGDMESLNQMTRDALACHVKGQTLADIRDFLDREVLEAGDSKRTLRAAFREKYIMPVNGCSAAQNIIKAILGE